MLYDAWGLQDDRVPKMENLIKFCEKQQAITRRLMQQTEKLMNTREEGEDMHQIPGTDGEI